LAASARDQLQVFNNDLVASAFLTAPPNGVSASITIEQIS